jgi:hypothetical protein
MLMGFCIPAGQAATMTWTGTNNWTNAVNWGGTVPGTGDTAFIQSGKVVLTGAVQVLNLILTNSATLIFSNWNLALTASNIMVLSNATITHSVNTSTVSPWTPNAGVFLICTTLTVQAGGLVNADSAGYGGRVAGSGYGPGGGGYGTYTGGGGGHGGRGGGLGFRRRRRRNE